MTEEVEYRREERFTEEKERVKENVREQGKTVYCRDGVVELSPVIRLISQSIRQAVSWLIVH